MNYGMFSDKGNAAVDAIVQKVLALDGNAAYRFDVAVGCLDELADNVDTDEAMDTVVRDAVWEALGLASAPPAGVTINQHGAVYRDGVVVGYVRKGGCENEACLSAMQAGRMYHAIPAGFAVTLPDYHFDTRDSAIAALLAVA